MKFLLAKFVDWGNHGQHVDAVPLDRIPYSKLLDTNDYAGWDVVPVIGDPSSKMHALITKNGFRVHMVAIYQRRDRAISDMVDVNHERQSDTIHKLNQLVGMRIVNCECRLVTS